MVQWKKAFQPLGYLAVGGSTFLLDLGILLILHHQLHVGVALATSIAFVIAFVVNFLLNRQAIFRSTRSSAHGFIRYISLALMNLLLTTAAVSTLASIGVPVAVARMGMAALTAGWNFPLYRHWVFV